MRLRSMLLAFSGAALICAAASDTSWAQSTSAPKSTPAPQAGTAGQTGPAGKEPAARVAGSYGNWTLLCGKEGDPKTAQERCSLVLPLIEANSQKLVFRVILTYGPKGRLVLRVDGPTGVALQRGVQVATESDKVYGLPFQTCLPMGCKALLLVSDEMRQDLATSNTATIVVYALNGRQIQTVAELKGLPLGLEALDKRRTALLEKN